MQKGCIENTLFPNKTFNIYFLKFGIGNRNKKECSQILESRMGMKNSIAMFWDWEQERKTVFPTQVGKELTKESWENVGNGNSGACLASTELGRK